MHRKGCSSTQRIKNKIDGQLVSSASVVAKKHEDRQFADKQRLSWQGIGNLLTNSGFDGKETEGKTAKETMTDSGNRSGGEGSEWERGSLMGRS